MPETRALRDTADFAAGSLEWDANLADASIGASWPGAKPAPRWQFGQRTMQVPNQSLTPMLRAMMDVKNPGLAALLAKAVALAPAVGAVAA
jgi:hypothetical protein